MSGHNRPGYRLPGTKKARRRERPGRVRLLAPCLTWRQYASNHHGIFNVMLILLRRAQSVNIGAASEAETRRIVEKNRWRGPSSRLLCGPARRTEDEAGDGTQLRSRR